MRKPPEALPVSRGFLIYCRAYACIFAQPAAFFIFLDLFCIATQNTILYRDERPHNLCRSGVPRTDKTEQEARDSECNANGQFHPY